MTTTYRLGGIDIASELPLPALAAPPAAVAVASIRLGRVPAALPDCTVRKLLCEATASDFLLRIPRVAGYWVRAGAEIIVDVVPGAAPGDVGTYLLSYAFAALCQQRQLLVLQATAVAMDGVAVLLLGASGGGKSTLGAALAARGHAVICDDVCVIETDVNPARVHPMGNRVGLWCDALEHFRYVTDRPVQMVSALQKYSVCLGPRCQAPTAVGCMLFLRTNHPPQPLLACAELRPTAAVAVTVEQTLLPWLVDAMARRAAHLQQCARTLDCAASFSIARRWGLDGVPLAADTIEQLVEECSMGDALRSPP